VEELGQRSHHSKIVVDGMTVDESTLVVEDKPVHDRGRRDDSSLVKSLLKLCMSEMGLKSLTSSASFFFRKRIM
jgi:hypothetical protein